MTSVTSSCAYEPVVPSVNERRGDLAAVLLAAFAVAMIVAGAATGSDVVVVAGLASVAVSLVAFTVAAVAQMRH